MVLYIFFFPFSVAQYVINKRIHKNRNNIIFCRYATIKSENHFNATVIDGICATDQLSVSKIQGRTNPNRYITAAIEIIIKAAGYIIAQTYFCLISLRYAYSSAND